MPKSNNWYVLTGGPSSGKTTLLTELAKLGHATVPEAARTVIDRAVSKGITPQELRKDEQYFQDEVTKLKIEIEQNHPRDVLTFFDRGMHDTIAYFRHYGYKIEQWTKDACMAASYQKIFLLEPLHTYEKDYARTEDESFFLQIHTLLKNAYTEAGMSVVSVPPLNVSNRVKFVLDHIKTGAYAK